MESASFSIDNLEICVDGNTSTLAILQRIFIEKNGFNNVKVIQGFGFDENTSSKIINSGSAKLMIRCCSPGWQKDLEILTYYKIPYIYLIDDNFWCLLGDSELELFYQNPLVRQTLESMVRNACFVVCHTQKFASFLRFYSNNVRVIPAFFDFSCLENNSSKPISSDEFRIGIVGNIAKSSDIDWLVPVVENVLKERGENVFFEFFGYIPAALKDNPHVRYFQAINDYKEFIKCQFDRGWMLGLAPLNDTQFSMYKTDNKFREFGGCQIAGVYSNCTVYQEVVQDDVTGWLLNNVHDEWIDKIIHLVDHPSETINVGINACNFVRKNLSLEHALIEWEKLFFDYDKFNEKENINILFKKSILKIFRIKSNNGPKIFNKNSLASDISFNQLNFSLSRNSVVMIDAGDELSTEVVAPISGDFLWSALVATFGKKLSGIVNFTVLQDGVSISFLSIKAESLEDAGVIKISSKIIAGARIVIIIKNNSYGPVGFFCLNKNSVTKFKSTNAVFPFGVFA